MMLAGIYYGCMYGGAVTAILINTPGDAPPCMTVLDGYPPGAQGRAGAALAIAAMSSVHRRHARRHAPPSSPCRLAEFALKFGPPIFRLMLSR